MCHYFKWVTTCVRIFFDMEDYVLSVSPLTFYVAPGPHRSISWGWFIYFFLNFRLGCRDKQMKVRYKKTFGAQCRHIQLLLGVSCLCLCVSGWTRVRCDWSFQSIYIEKHMWRSHLHPGARWIRIQMGAFGGNDQWKACWVLVKWLKGYKSLKVFFFSFFVSVDTRHEICCRFGGDSTWTM